jgi:hypothetical protein
MKFNLPMLSKPKCIRIDFFAKSAGVVTDNVLDFGKFSLGLFRDLNHVEFGRDVT